MSEARFHHYHFAHRALPSAFFENPNDSMRLLQSSIGNQWLNRLWQASGEKIISPNEGAILEAIGLSVTTCFVGDRDCVLVRMPAPECALEVYFALLVNEHESRYFVLERTGEATSNEPIGVVCEWLEDGGRRNHQLHIHADEEVFGDTVAELLHREEVRRQAGVRHPVVAIEWNPAREEQPDEFSTQEAFRMQHCTFAFEVIPEAVRNNFDDWCEATKGDRIQNSY